MKQLMSTVLVLTIIVIPATSWAERSTITRETVVDSSKTSQIVPQVTPSPPTPPRLNPQPKPSSPRPPSLSPQTKPRPAGSIVDQSTPSRPTPQPNPLIFQGEAVIQPMNLLPDLQVEHIFLSSTNANPKEGQEVTIISAIKNHGLGAAVNPEVTLATTVQGPTGVMVPAFPFTYNETLTEGQQRPFIKKFIVPKWGSYTSTLTVDPANKIGEVHEINNDKSVSFSVDPAPDLTVCIDNGKRPPVFAKREIKAVVKNIGQGSTGTADLKLYFYVEGHGAQYYDIPMLSGNAAHTITRNHKWPTSGTKTITARVIYDGYEFNGLNNEANGSYFVRLPHHDKYGIYTINCSTGATFNSWQTCWDQYINVSH